MYDWQDCQTKNAHRSALARLLICLPVAIDRRWRLSDFRLNRTYGGPAESVLGPKGHPFVVLLLPALLGLFVVFGPGLGERGAGAYALYGLAVGLLVLGSRLASERGLLAWHLLWMALLCAVVWILAGPEARAVDATLYRHIVVGLTPLALLPAIAVAFGLTRVLFRPPSEPSPFREALTDTELFAMPVYPEIGWLEVLRGQINAALQKPLLLLFLPSLALVVFHRGQDPRTVGLLALLLSQLFLALATVHPRLDAMVSLLDRVLFRGGQLVVTLALITLAVARFVGVHYVADVLESSRRSTLALFLLAAYAFFWFYEYWLNWLLCARLLRLLRDPDVRGPVGRVPYPFTGPTPTRVPDGERVLQIHGGARYVVLGPALPSGRTPFQFYERGDLFDRLGRAAPDALTALRSRMRTYFTVTNLLLIGMAVVGALWLSRGVQSSVVQADRTAEGPVDLRELLFRDPARGDAPRVLLALSGGGTRAALYATSLLEGLHREEALDQVVLLSGVSGGGAALAYYLAHREALDAGVDSAWARFRCTMDDPFIEDVLEGAPEWRILAGTRLGQLLAESFGRRFQGPRPRVADLPTDQAFILNTALAGSLRIAGEDTASVCTFTDPDGFPPCAELRERETTSSLAGGRLIFTNLTPASAFPGRTSAVPGHALDYVVFADGAVPLAGAAGLAANFPPFFPNAPVDSWTTRERFWVTDGGATDNRGVISLLLALRDALTRELADPSPVGRTLPPLEIVVAEASAGSLNYNQDRGLGSRFGAPAQFASQLMQELVTEIRRLYGALGAEDPEEAVRLHYLEMPPVLRVEGGLGTHWMLPERVTLARAPRGGPGADARTVVDGLAVRDVIFALHSAETTPLPVCADDDAAPEALSGDVRRTWNAIAGVERETGPGRPAVRTDPHAVVWDALRAALR
ncbi:MAG: patatin-like phospholipase family protein [Gemmatimonadota bacterium]|nr:patatin-like phospholipase family protein [Gemmatimonadota bacterium]